MVWSKGNFTEIVNCTSLCVSLMVHLQILHIGHWHRGLFLSPPMAHNIIIILSYNGKQIRFSIDTSHFILIKMKGQCPQRVLFGPVKVTERKKPTYCYICYLWRTNTTVSNVSRKISHFLCIVKLYCPKEWQRPSKLAKHHFSPIFGDKLIGLWRTKHDTRFFNKTIRKYPFINW